MKWMRREKKGYETRADKKEEERGTGDQRGMRGGGGMEG